MVEQQEVRGRLINARVLLVSNDPLTGPLWDRSLRQSGSEVIVAGSAEATLAYWSKETFGLTIIDVDGPELGGIELCRHLRTQTDKLILLLTYNPCVGNILSAYEAGVDYCLVKPANSDLFLARVQALLRRMG